MSGVEQWARIVAVRPALGRAKSIDLEIHWNGQPPFEVNSLSVVPRGITAQVGQDVAYRESIGDDHTHYEIEWNKPPRYGPPPGTTRDSVVDRLTESQPSALVGFASRASRLRMAQNMLERGLITQAEFDRAQQALGSQADDPE